MVIKGILPSDSDSVTATPKFSPLEGKIVASENLIDAIFKSSFKNFETIILYFNFLFWLILFKIFFS